MKHALRKAFGWLLADIMSVEEREAAGFQLPSEERRDRALNHIRPLTCNNCGGLAVDRDGRHRLRMDPETFEPTAVLMCNTPSNN